ncbi:MAG: energy transducer TonB [Acidobacteriia bacterium]|nr:energy transducer TonB [Terriglobia bacterium]
MSYRRCSVLFVVGGIIALGGRPIDSITLQPCTPMASMQGISAQDQDSMSFDNAPMYLFVSQMMRRLDIAAILVDSNVQLQGSVTIHKDAPVSKQELMSFFVDALRDRDAVLVKSGGIMQIVPISRASGEGFETATSPADIVPRVPGGNVRMRFDNASISDFISGIADLLHITPIVISPAIRGNVTLLNEAAITRDLAYSILSTVLKNNDARIIESAANYQVVPASRDVPQGWKVFDRQPALDRSAGGQRRYVKQEELESHILSRVEPALVSADGHRLSGKVQLEIALNERGELNILRAVAPASLPLAEAAMEAVRQWRFKPFVDANGFPQRVYGLITIVFNAPKPNLAHTSRS